MGSKPKESLRDTALKHMGTRGGRCWVWHSLPKELLPEVNAILRDTSVQVTALCKALHERGIRAATADKLRHHRDSHLLRGIQCP